MPCSVQILRKYLNPVFVETGEDGVITNDVIVASTD